MTMLLYSAALTLALVLSAPWWIARMLTTGRYREGLSQRLGFVPAALRDYAAGHRIVWLHAVSVGETLAATRLIAELEAALGPDFRIVISTTTRTGQALARERFRASDHHHARVFYLPLDFAFAIRACLRALQPAALILMESELWPRLLHECTVRNIPVAVVNARISDRSYRRAQRFRALWSRILRQPTLWLTQSDEDTRRLHSLISPNPVILSEARTHPNSVPLSEAPSTNTVISTEAPSTNTVISTEAPSTNTVISTEAQRSGETPVFENAQRGDPTILTTGNLKYDIRAPKQSRIAELIREATIGRPIIVAGSTLAGEDELIVAAFDRVWSRIPRAFMVLAPRHPERFEAAILAAELFGAVRATALLEGDVHKMLRQTATPNGKGVTLESNTLVVVLDTIGDLASMYGMASVAFVGGSIVEGGGHNPLEPAQFGVPVVMGPSYQNFRTVVQTMKDAEAIHLLSSEETGLPAKTASAALNPDVPNALRDELADTIIQILTHPDEARALGERGRSVFEREQGATARTITALLTMIPGATR
jgi:3-deoxy-D-manno-octulosonic-acid transferase